MKNPSIKLQVIKPGLLTLVQGTGRTGQQAYGLPIGGVMDRREARAANWLVGQAEDVPVLEITLQGPEIHFGGPVQIALTGADLSPEVDGEPVSQYKTLDIQKGQTLSFGATKSGCRTYLAIRGAWQVPEWLGSFGGLPVAGTYWPSGSRLEKGTEISILRMDPVESRSIQPAYQPFHSHELTVRVMAGPEFSWFPESSIQYFVTHPFTVGPDSNRMGYRLRENLPGFKLEKELISSGIVPGTVQVLPSGSPVVLLADAQTSGGYPRIANIVSSDLDYLAQLVPGDKIRFVFL